MSIAGEGFVVLSGARVSRLAPRLPAIVLIAMKTERPPPKTTTARVVILDHHKTAAEQLGIQLPAEHDYAQPSAGVAAQLPAAPLPPNLHVLFDMNRSGAVLSLDFFGREGFTDEMLRAYRCVRVCTACVFGAGKATIKSSRPLPGNFIIHTPSRLILSPATSKTPTSGPGSCRAAASSTPDWAP